MRRLLIPIAFVLLLGGAGSAPAGIEGPTTIGVRNGASEFSFSLSRTKVESGPAIIQYQNTGEDPHDLKIRRKGGDEILEIGVTQPGVAQALAVDRLKGDSIYKLWCSLEGHAEAGMKAKIGVARRR